MPPIKTEGFVLKRIDFRETSVILTLFTKELGKIKGILKGVRKENSKISPLTFSEGAYIHSILYKRKSGLNLLSSPLLIDFPNYEKKISFKIYFWILKLIDLFISENQTDENIFSLLDKTMKILKVTNKPWLIFLGFKIKLIGFLGYGIRTDICCKCNKYKKISFFSPKMGGVICKECGKEEINCIKITNKVNSIIKFIKKTDLKNIENLNIKKEEGEKINFLGNLTIYYHTNLDFIWWKNEKNIFRGDY
ncbi:MAG: DNA repair protein RecO [Candidatus Omnitrophica bacterium]|nr:DNA repair protein RecO [Candidatus Omnitrophota bacterium]